MRPWAVLTTEKVLSQAEQEVVLAKCITAIRKNAWIHAKNGVRDGDNPRTRDPAKRFLRDPLMILLAIECGMRSIELRDLEAHDFKRDQPSLFIRTRKGGKPREIPLKGFTSAALEKWILRRSGAQKFEDVPETLRIFPVSYMRWRDAWFRFRPNTRRKCHSTRHGFAVSLYTRSRDVRLVQLALGHRSLSNTQIYLDFCYSQEELRKFIHAE